MLPARFWSKVKTSDIHSYNDTPCFEWTASTIREYGQFGLNGKNYLAHRLSYEDVKGKIPEGLELDHLCRNHKCVNTDHLQAVPHKENIRRGLAGFLSGLKQRLKTHCPQGHEYTKENTYIQSNGNRNCKICKLIQNRQYKQDKKRWRT